MDRADKVFGLEELHGIAKRADARQDDNVRGEEGVLVGGDLALDARPFARVFDAKQVAQPVVDDGGFDGGG